MPFEGYGPGVYGPYYNAGAPVAGTNEVQTLTLGGTFSSGTFTVAVDGVSTAPVTYAAGAGLATNLNTALDAKFGAAQIVVTGTGPYTITFSGSNYARRDVPLMTANIGGITGTAPTMTFTVATPGVNQTLRNVQPGSLMIDTTNAQTYQAGGTLGAITWGKIGTQT